MYLDELFGKLEKFAKIDSDFPATLRSAMFSNEIYIHLKPEGTRGWYVCSIDARGRLCIGFSANSVWTNISELGNDIPSLLSVNGIPYPVHQQLIVNRPKHESLLSESKGVLGSSSQVTLIADFFALRPMLEKQSYGIDRYADIYYVDYLRAIVDLFKYLIRKYDFALGMLKEKFSGHKIIILATI